NDIASFMLISAKTAPKAKGKDDVLFKIATEKEKDEIAKRMRELAEERGKNWERDANSIDTAQSLVIVGVRGRKPIGLDCGACGMTCEELKKTLFENARDFKGPFCAFKVLDLGIALGSAVKTAQIHNIDNRIIYRVGVVAKQLKILDEADIIMGIPLAVTSKSPFFDR
ncbi:MAG: ferredoxin domain-containing protein, partial [Candidatus Hodarchaeota archaeon]